MPKGLFVLPGLHRRLHEPYVAGWLASLQHPRSETFYEGIDRLPPGHFLRVTPNTFECRQYWHPANAKPTRFKKDEEYAEAILEIFDRAVEARLRSTKQIGCQLSAGLDSSSVAASAARLLAAQGKGLTAFTSVPRPDFNGIVESWFLPSEAEGAADVARLYPNIEHLTVDSRGYDLLSTMKTWTDAWNEPCPNVVNMLWYSAILEQAKQRGIGVVLEGTMGN
jgi:asparagine synthase (glutamine-hydrolysing)